jgi:predicted metalloendopeptidase
MIDKHYHDSAINKYGKRCEICGFAVGLEVHHLNYQEHQAIEDQIRKAERSGDHEEMIALINKAKAMGFDEYVNFQLAKDDSTRNLSVVCANHHNFIHITDMGLKILKALPPRV